MTLLVSAQADRGVPTWRDTENLPTGPVGDRLIETLESADTANVIWWLTPDVKDSLPILRLEAPRIMSRVRRGDGFFTEACLANGLDYADVETVLRDVQSVERPGNGWNLRKVRSPLDHAGARRIANEVLRSRLRSVIAHDAANPLRLVLHTRPDAPLGWVPDATFQIDWSCYFRGRHATADVWQTAMLPALQDIVTAAQEIAPIQTFEATGKCCLAAAFALGRSFMEPSGLHLVWKQYTSGAYSPWSLRDEPVDSGFTCRIAHNAFDSSELDVFIKVRDNVEPAVHASNGHVPDFGVVIRISRPEARGTESIDSPSQAVHLSRLVSQAIRTARQQHPHLQTTHLFLSGPVGLAVLIGQQLNGVGPVHTYEHLQTGGPGSYTLAARLGDPLTELAVETMEA